MLNSGVIIESWSDMMSDRVDAWRDKSLNGADVSMFHSEAVTDDE